LSAVVFLPFPALTQGPIRPESLPAHPRLLFNADGIAHLKDRTQDPAWSAQWKAFQSRYDNRMKEKVELPPRGSNWGHWYICPTHGARLTTGKQLDKWQWEHICSVGHEIVKSDPTRPDRDFDGCVLAGIHDRYARDVQSAGILYQITHDDRYVKWGREILLAYADRYLSYPLHTIRGEPKIGGGRLSPQTLDESVWLIPAAQGADMLWDKLSDADRQIIADKLFLPAARDVILPHHMPIHNIQCWKNSAVGLTGLLLGDAALMQAAIDDPDRGYRVQMSKGVQSDGVWHEGAWGYHFYTMSAVWPLVEAARNCGINLYGEPFKKMFEAPVQLAMPNLMLPAFNDSTETNVRSPLYELAYARYHDPIDLVALAGVNRNNEYALWFGVDSLPDASASPSLGSRNAADSGYAILQRGSGDQATWLCVKYGPHGGGHGHPDKNNFVLYSKGRVLFPDAGTRLYGSPLHGEWDRVTMAHNTLVVDEKSQRPATGKCLAFGSNQGVDYAMTDAGNIYDGVRYVRTVALLNENLAVFLDQVQADRSHTFDLAIHHIGRWVKASGGDKIQLPAKEGYQHLQDVASAGGLDGVTLTLEADGGVRTAITLAGNEKTQVITATGIGKSTEDRVPVALFRRVALQATYAWATSLDGTPVKVKVTTLAPGVVGVQVDDNWKLSIDRDRGKVIVTGRPSR
jgi:hypothetical protein